MNIPQFRDEQEQRTFFELMASLQLEPPPLFMMRVAAHAYLHPAAKLVFVPIMLEFLPEVHTVDAWIFIIALNGIMRDATLAGLVQQGDEWFRLWDAVLARFGQESFWKTGDEWLHQELLLLLYEVVCVSDRFPDQLLVDYDWWKEAIETLETEDFRDEIREGFRTLLQKFGYIKALPTDPPPPLRFPSPLALGGRPAPPPPHTGPPP